MEDNRSDRLGTCEESISDVLSGKKIWDVVQADALEFLRRLPEDAADLLFCSPPY